MLLPLYREPVFQGINNLPSPEFSTFHWMQVKLLISGLLFMSMFVEGQKIFDFGFKVWKADTWFCEKISSISSNGLSFAYQGKLSFFCSLRAAAANEVPLIFSRRFR